MEIFGKPAINPVLFYSGNIIGYMNWTLLVLSVLSINIPGRHIFFHNDYMAIGLLLTGVLISSASMFYLGRSTRFGLPTSRTILKTNGMYRFSRNPMYLGFDLVTLASMIWFLNPPLICTGVYSIVVYHLIIKAEEKFLEGTFGTEYLEYKKEVRRYI